MAAAAVFTGDGGGGSRRGPGQGRRVERILTGDRLGARVGVEQLDTHALVFTLRSNYQGHGQGQARGAARGPLNARESKHAVCSHVVSGGK